MLHYYMSEYGYFGLVNATLMQHFYLPFYFFIQKKIAKLFCIVYNEICLTTKRKQNVMKTITEKYCNMKGWTDSHPYEIVRVVSDKCLEIRPMKAEKNPDFKPEFEVGGFSAHCTNNHDQKWIITSMPEAGTIRVRKRKTQKNYGEGVYWHQQARYQLSDKPHYFYDYNF